MFREFLTFALAFDLASAVIDNDGPLIIPFIGSRPAAAPAKLLVIVPTFGPPEAYRGIAEAIQAGSSLRLAIAVPKCHSKLPSPRQYLCDPVFELPNVIPDAISIANHTVNGSIRGDHDVFVGGHSVGGASARSFVDTKYSGAAGVFTLGTQYNGDSDGMLGYLGYPVDVKSYPLPFLGLTGELDKFPTSHAALFLKRLMALDNAGKGTQLQKYVAILPGVDQSSYVDEPYVSPGDIVADVPRTEAQSAAGKVIGAWVDLVSQPSSAEESRQVLEGALKVTRAIAQPFLDAIDADETWCAKAQKKIPGVPDIASIKMQHVPFSKLDTCHTSDAVGPDGALILNLCDYSAYNYGHRPPWQASYAGATAIACKMIGEDRIAQTQKLPLPDMTAPSVVNFCQQINRDAFATGKELVRKHWPKAVERFEAQGKQIRFQNDTQTSGGPFWLLKGLGFTELEQQIEVSGVSLISSVKSFVYPGNHYCKLLSPSVSVEVIMTMGLTHRIPGEGESPLDSPAALIV